MLNKNDVKKNIDELTGQRFKASLEVDKIVNEYTRYMLNGLTKGSPLYNAKMKQVMIIVKKKGIYKLKQQRVDQINNEILNLTGYLNECS